MACSNCYTGCTQITSDKCVKYTGLPNTLLGIQTGDSLSYVEQALIGFVTANADGSGIKYELEAGDMCTVMSQHLIECTDVTVVDITKALSKAICTLDSSIITLTNAEATLEGAYTPGCISVAGTEGTHIVLQATMDQACTNATDITAVASDLSTNYVAIADVDTYIADYIAANAGGGATGESAKMVPYTVVEYYGSLTYFDATGAGTGDWANVYLCNGNNNTPDKRGRVAVGTTSGMGGGTFSSVVNPAVSGNPTYSLYSTGGANTTTLTISQLPAHTHTGTTATDGAHTHTITTYVQSGSNDGSGGEVAGFFDTVSTSSDGAHSHTFTTSSIGGGGSHSNVQPVLACHYIMYIPAP